MAGPSDDRPRTWTVITGVAGSIAIACALRLFAIFQYRIDSDEAQHLHVAWSWTHGLIPYRDYFDNHLPLFHMLFAPLLALAGETDRILLIGRLAMLPLAALTLAMTWCSGRKLFGPAVATWGTIVASVLPPVLLKGVEFRNDNLWTLLVVTMVAAAVARRLPARFFVIGLLAGTALAVSIKTVHVLVAIAVCSLLFRRLRVRPLIHGVAGFVIIPAAIGAYFYSQGALMQLWYWAIHINGAVAVETWRRIAGMFIFAMAIAFVLYLRRRPEQGDRTFIAALVVVATGSVFAISPLISPRDFLPFFCIASLYLAAALREKPVVLWSLPAALAICTFLAGRLWTEPDPTPRRLIAETLRLTRPEDVIFDLKGETIFRKRATFIALERVGREMLARGVVPDTTIEDIVASRCHVTIGTSSFIPPRTRSFLEEHFLRLGTLRLAGARPDPFGRFSIAVPGVYEVIFRSGSAGRIRWYEPGEYRLPPPAGALVVWKPAVDRIGQRSIFGTLRGGSTPPRDPSAGQ